MKKKIIILILTITAILTCIVALTTCKNEHVHNYTESITAPTCTTRGFTTYTCSCGDSYNDNYVDAVGHKVNPELYANATEHWNLCISCYTPINNEAHTWNNGIVTLPATITTTGIKTYTCTTCEKTKQEEIPLVEHTCHYNANWFTDATSHWQECTVCGKEKNNEEHTWNSGVITQEATTTAVGIKTYTCTICEKKKYEDIPAIPHNHNYSSTWSSNDAYHWHACDACDEMNSKAEHLWNEGIITLPATKTSTGIKTYTCTTCKNIKTETIPMLPSSNEPTYALNAAGTEYTVVGFDGNATEITIPDTYNGLRVTSIGENAFLNNTYVKKVTLPNTVTSISAFAFKGCGNLTQINIPESVLQIDNNAFEGCNSLNKLTFAIEINESSNTLTIGDSAFKNCINLTSVQLAQYTEKIGNSSFENCYSLKSITINDKLKYIGTSAFAKCIALSEATLNNGLIGIGSYAFDECEALTDVVIPDTVKTVGMGAFRNAKSLQSVTLSANMTAIANSTFQNCISLQEIELHKQISDIGISAFSCCTALKTVDVLGNITSWGNNAFYRCENLTSLYINSSTTKTLYNENYIFYNAGIKGTGITLTVGKNGYIPDGLFEPLHAVNAPKITTIVIEEGVTEIAYFTEYNYLPYLTSVSIPDCIQVIEKDLFNNAPVFSYNEYEGVYYLGNSENPYVCLVKPIYLNSDTYTIHGETKCIANAAFFGCSALKNITIPDGVTSIGASSFGGCSIETATIPTLAINYIGKDKLTSVTITSGTSIGNMAFIGCSALTSVIIPDSVTSIGKYAFEDCTALESVNYTGTIDQWVQIDFSNYASNPLYYAKKLYINNELVTNANITTATKISNYAFQYCTALTSVTIPDSVTSIGDSAFLGCSSLKEMTLPFVGARKDATGYEAVFGYIFGYTTSSSSSATSGATYQYYDSSSSWSYIYYHYYIPTSLTKITITGGDAIPSNAFCNCSTLTSITIPDSVTSIDSYAFGGCTGLESITIGDSVTSIGDYAFYNCSSLKEMTLPFVGANKNATGYKKVFGYIFGWTTRSSSSATSGATYQYYDSSSSSSYSCYHYYIPTSLTKITITGGDTIPSNAFYNCSTLTSVTIPDSVTSIGSYAFYNCTALTSLTIPDSVTSIGSYAFYNCTSLTSVTIGDNVTFIDNHAFYNCTALTSANYTGTIDQWVQINFNYYYSNPLYYAKKLYINNELVTNANITTATKISNYAFQYCTALTSVTIPDSVTSIGDYAFRYCSSLKSVTIGDSVTSIGSYAFDNCYKLAEVINKSNLSITKGSSDNGYIAYYALNVKTEGASDIVNVDDYLFLTVGETNYLLGYAGNKTDLVLPDKYNDQNYKIYKYAFYYCRALTSVTIPDSVTSIGDHAFDWCLALTSVTIAGSVTSIGDSAFYNCTSLESVYYKGTIDQWVQIDFNSYDSNPLYYAKKLYINNELVTKANITTATKISDYAFSNCTALTSVTIPVSVTSIGNNAFWSCTSLKSITIPDSVTSISSFAFNYCTALTSVTIGNGVTSIGYEAFYGCRALESVYYKGTESEWNKISIDSTYDGNYYLTSATRYYYSESNPFEGESAVTSGNYWHYDINGEIVVWKKQ